MPLDTAPRPDWHGGPAEPHPALPRNVNDHVDYEPHPVNSISVTPARLAIMERITSLYCGSGSEEDMAVYAEQSVYDDPFNYYDERHKIVGHWYGIPMIFPKSETVATEIVSSTEHELVWKQRQKYMLAGLKAATIIDSLVSLRLDGEPPNEKVVHHKDVWSSQDYSHEGQGLLFKKLNQEKVMRALTTS